MSSFSSTLGQYESYVLTNRTNGETAMLQNIACCGYYRFFTIRTICQ